MNHRRPALLALTLGLLLATPAHAEFHGEWRLILSTPAPWVDAAELPVHSLRIGDRLLLGPDGIEGPAPLACGHGQTSTLQIPAEGLFQGGLVQPAADAERLGFGQGSHPSLRIDCDSGSWDFHAVEADVLVFALDHRIHTLGRSPGALAAPDSPQGRVQRLLEAHFAAGLRFDPASTAALGDLLSDALQQDIAHYFAAPWPADEVPPINGDPYTDSQEPPTRFKVLDALIDGENARVEVEFADAYRRKRFHYLLQQEAGSWRLRDIEWNDAERLVELLAERPD